MLVGAAEQGNALSRHCQACGYHKHSILAWFCIHRPVRQDARLSSCPADGRSGHGPCTSNCSVPCNPLRTSHCIHTQDRMRSRNGSRMRPIRPATCLRRSLMLSQQSPACPRAVKPAATTAACNRQALTPGCSRTHRCHLSRGRAPPFEASGNDHLGGVTATGCAHVDTPGCSGDAIAACHRSARSRTNWNGSRARSRRSV